MPPIASIEQIARSEDRTQAIVFFLFFARFEYALKRAGFTRKREEAMADWEKYARSVASLLTKNNEERFKEAVALLQSEPPKKQVVSGSRLVWSADCETGSFDLSRIFALVRRVRNNLFHGEKFPEGPEAERISSAQRPALGRSNETVLGRLASPDLPASRDQSEIPHRCDIPFGSGVRLQNIHDSRALDVNLRFTCQHIDNIAQSDTIFYG